MSAEFIDTFVRRLSTLPALDPEKPLISSVTSFGERLEQWRREIDVPKLTVELGIAVCVGVFVYTALSFFLRFVKNRFAEPTGHGVRRVVGSIGQTIGATSPLFVFVTALTAASEMISLPVKAHAFFHGLFIITLFVQAALWANVAANGWLSDYTTRRGATDASVMSATAIIGVLLRSVIWAIALLLMLDNLGINVTTLIAGLGIGGIAIGLAAQNILGDLFGSLSILLDKPFVVGDFIVSGDHMGTVERIGLKTTRIRSQSGEQLIISNHDLLTSRIRNYKLMAERRVAFTVRVIYDTPTDKLAKVPDIIKAAVERQKPVRFDRSHFSGYGDFAVMFETVYYVLSQDYNLHMDIQQAIYLEIHKQFAAQDISFAFPTRSIMAQTPGFSAPKANGDQAAPRADGSQPQPRSNS